MDPLFLAQIALTFVALSTIFLWFWQGQLTSAEAGGQASTPPALTRSVYLGMLATLFIFARCYKTSVDKLKLISLPIALVAILALIYAGSGRLASEDRRACGGVQMSEVDIRIALLYKSFALFQEEPLLGIGLAQYVPTAARSLRPPSRPFELEDMQTQFQHNRLLGIATELGITGLAVYLSLLILLFRRLTQLAGKLPKNGLLGDNLRFVVLSVWSVYIISNMLITPEPHLFFNAAPFIFAGLLDGIYTRSLEADDQRVRTQSLSPQPGLAAQS